MALPTSTIVMAVLTCIPFGLAIRDTVNGKAPVARGDDDAWDADDDDSSSDDDDAEYARMEAEREAEEAETVRLDALKQEQLRVARRTLFGAEVATLGSGFDGITLGMPEAGIPSETITLLEEDASVDIEPLANTTLDWLTIKAESDDDDGDAACSKLGQDLQDAWGRGKTEDYESRYWVNQTTGTRAAFDPTKCQLSFERFAEPKAWVNKTKTSLVPISLVGQSLAKLRAHNATLADLDATESSHRWLGLGVGIGYGEARFEAFTTKGKVVAIVATVNAFETTREEVIAQLTTMYGEPIEDDDGVHWKSRPAIALDDYEGAGIRLTVGKVPQE